jgi:hypothetical protein
VIDIDCIRVWQQVPEQAEQQVKQRGKTKQPHRTQYQLMPPAGRVLHTLPPGGWKVGTHSNRETKQYRGGISTRSELNSHDNHQ